MAVAADMLSFLGGRVSMSSVIRIPKSIVLWVCIEVWVGIIIMDITVCISIHGSLVQFSHARPWRRRGFGVVTLLGVYVLVPMKNSNFPR
jgi:hypothetical protein